MNIEAKSAPTALCSSTLPQSKSHCFRLALFKRENLNMSTLLLSPIHPEFSLEDKIPFDGALNVPLTPVQEQLMRSVTPSWLAAEIRLPSSTGITLESIQQAWSIVAARNDVLRTSIRFALSPGFLLQLSEVTPVLITDHPLERCADFDSAHLIVSQSSGKLVVFLHMPQLLVDERSIRLIEHDLALVQIGAMLVTRDPFFTYVTEVNSRDAQAALEHWKSVLPGIYPMRTPFPSLSPPTARTNVRSQIVLDAGIDTLIQLRSFADEYATGEIFTVLQATWALVLSAHMGIEDVAFAVVLRDRCSSLRNPHTVVGRMDVTFPTHAHVSPSSPLIALFESLKHAQYDGERFGYIGFNRILEQWGVPNPFIFSALRICGRGGQPASKFAIEDDTFPLTLRFGVLNSFRLEASFDSSFPKGRIAVLLDHFLTSLKSILSMNAFSANVGDVPILSPSEHSMLVEQATPRAPMRRELIHRLVEARAQSAPHSIAVEELESWRAWTAGEINRFANIVARQLNCDRNSIIPVCLNRSAHLVIALLAILKTGSAYVILDPDHPQERLRLILNDINAPFVISSSKLASRFDLPVKDISLLLGTPAGDQNLEVSLDCRSRSYIVYTSGSSGRPKGVELTHSAATTGILAASPSPDARSLLFFNPIFSAAQRTIWATIINGGTLCLASKESLMTDLAGVITKMRVNTIGVTTTTASLLQDVPTLKTVTLTGERVTDAVVERWADAVDLRSGYGLSECTQLNWSKSLSRDAPANKIDRPSDSTSAFVLVPETTVIAPRLVPGELCLAGPQLALGYLGLPHLTEAAFIPNPFGEGRLYRTGDKAVYHEDGSIELLGRIDRQVKVAGQRVDPEEVETVLRQHASVRSVAVEPVVLGGVTTLVACIVFDQDVDESVVRHTQDLLPPFAVPSYWLRYEFLPTTVTGKTAHSTLRTELSLLSRDDLLSRSLLSSSTSKLAASTPEEQILSTTCAEVIGLSDGLISMDSSFVVLGGTSLQAIQLSSLLRKKGWVVGVSEIIQASTLGALATQLVATDLSGAAVPETFSLVDRSIIDNDTLDWSIFEDIYPSSSLQEGLIAATLSGNKDYLYQRVYDVSGQDIPRLRNALEQVFRRDSLLRTTFFPSGPSILQGVLPASTPLPWIEVPSSCSLQEYKEKDTEEGVHLGSPFWRVAFFPDSQILVISSHHALFDFWSNSFPIDDAALIYDGRSPIERPPYNTFIQHLQSIDRNESKAFWSAYLQNASPSHLNVADPTNSSIIVRSLPNVTQDFQKAHSITLGTLIYSAWALVLRIHNISPQCVTFATTLAARDLPIANLDAMNGPTLTTVPQRIHFPDIESLTTLDFVKGVQDGLWGMMKHSQYGMRDALQLTHEKAGLFNTMVNIVTKDKRSPNRVFKPYGPTPVWRTEYVSLEVALPDSPSDPIDVKLVSPLGAREAEFVMTQFVNAFTALSATSPSQKILDLRLLGAEEVAFLESRALYAPGTDAVVHAAMEAIALATPERPALEWEDGTVVSYGELNAKADRVAAALIERGVGPDVLVPVCIDKSIEMIVSLYGILKAGGAFVPLDPENPVERNRFICQDVEAVVAVTVPEHAHIFDEHLPLILLDKLTRTSVNVRGDHEEVQVSRTLLLSESKGTTGGRKALPITNGRTPSPTGAAPPTLTSNHLAYAIYTSGSTGAPKGVLINHYSISTFVTGRILAEGYLPSWRTLLFANYVFDVSVSDIFTVLSVGGVLCLASMESLMTNLSACIASFNANQISLTPTVARLLPSVPPSLTHMVLGGEPCSAELVAMFAPHLTLFNSYGPTETTVYVTWGDMPPEKSPRIIGFPMYGVGSMILQPGTMDIVPYGAIGELCVLGPYVARGYLNRPDSTAKSFISWSNGETMYRTGDLIRWEPSGELACYGRRDNQVKIAGHRMELGEIEHAITATDIGNGRCVVVLTVAGKPQLAAFVLIEAEDELDGDEASIILPSTAYVDEISALRTQLAVALPPYMVPKIWIPVSRFPITPNSRKIDGALLTRLGNALPDLNQYSNADSAQGPYVECTTPVEFLLRELWADILQVDITDIGATSSFFHFGGDSISAISLVGKCRSRGVGALSVGDVLANPTLRDMATKVKGLSVPHGAAAVAKAYTPSSEVYELAGLAKEDVDAVLPAGPGQIEFLELSLRPEKFWLLQTTRELPADLDVQRWIEVTAELTRRNPILRTTFVKDGSGKWLQVVLKSTAPRVREVEVADEEEMKIVVQEEWDNEFANGEPWARYVVVSLQDGRRFLLHRVSHAVYDGTSLRVLDAQFVAIARGEPVPSVPAFDAFIEYTETLDREQRLAFWRKTLDGCSFDYPPLPPVAAPACNAISLVHFDNGIDACAPKHGVTVPIVFQTAFSLLLARLRHGTDIAYDSLVTGRDLPVEGAQEMSGACATFLPFRVQFARDTPLGALFKRTQAIFWETNEHGDISILDILPVQNRCLFLFQPFEPSKGAAVDHMRWCVLGMSKVRQEMNYALMMEVFKTAAGGYVVRLRHDSRVYSKAEIEAVGEELRAIVALLVSSDEDAKVEAIL
ncbi:hypothetical protein DFH06DRAFT_694313 [Mycena polygramma]|nr:hypothetical protein DFH06DRAFT_694313 [Mycena polygramma]